MAMEANCSPGGIQIDRPVSLSQTLDRFRFKGDLRSYSKMPTVHYVNSLKKVSVFGSFA